MSRPWTGIKGEGQLLQTIFQYGTPEYEFRKTSYVGHCSKCGHTFKRGYIRLRVKTSPTNTILLCPTGNCVEWFFRALFSYKDGV